MPAASPRHDAIYEDARHATRNRACIYMGT